MTTETEPRRQLSIYVAHLIEGEIASRGRGAWRPLADDWGVTHPTLQHICRDLKGIGPDVEFKLAAKLAGGKRDVLSERAKEWCTANPDWLPEKYKRAHGAGPTQNRKWKWWAAAAKKAAQEHPELDWAIDAAGREPQGSEPREDKRLAHVLGATNMVLNLPEERQQALENGYRKAHPSTRRKNVRRNPQRPSGSAPSDEPR
jgi:hypothetical protein